MVCMANDFVSMVLSVGITMFLCAPVYMLMVSRIGKRFVTLIYMTLLGVIFLLMGNWLSLIHIFPDRGGADLGCGCRFIRNIYQRCHS